MRYWPVILLLLLAVSNGHAETPPEKTLAADHTLIRWSGRRLAEQGAVRFGYPAVSATVRVSGGTLGMTAHSTKAGSLLSVTVDDGEPRRIRLSDTPERYPLLQDAKGPHTLRIRHESETWRGIVTLEGFHLTGGDFLPPPPAPGRKLLVIGDSVTCGEGVYTPQEGDCKTHPREPGAGDSYGMLMGHALHAETQLVCYGGRGLIRSWNGRTDELQAPQFFDLAIAEQGGPAADLQAFVPDIILVSLGTNDFNLGIGALPEQDTFVGAYVHFAERLLALYPEAIVALTEGSIVNDQADPARPQKTRLREYIAQTVAKIDSPRLHQLESPYYPGDSCDAHPTGAQHRAMANALLEQLNGPVQAIERHDAKKAEP